MSGWSILMYGWVSFTGTVYFLKLVGNAVDEAQGVTAALENHERKLYRQRLEAGEFVAPSEVDVVRTE